jgi:AcrR family transcriptional regulator
MFRFQVKRVSISAMTAVSPDPALEVRARRIIETTIELAEKGGFEAVRLRDVAAHAGVAMGTLYRRFRSKEDLLVAALELETRAMADRIAERLPVGETPGQRVVGFFEIATRGMLRRPNLSRAMLRASVAGEPALAQKVEIFHELMLRMTVSSLRGKALSEETPDLNDRERLLGEVLNQIWFAVMMGWSSGLQTQSSINERMRASVKLVLDGANRDS